MKVTHGRSDGKHDQDKRKLHMEVIWEMQLKGMQVTHETSQNFESKICQDLVHTLAWCCGSGLEE